MTTPTCEDPIKNFTENFLIDISSGFIPITIGLKLDTCVIPTYEKNKPKNSINSIFNDFRNCVEPTVASAATITATKLTEAIFYIVILTAVFMILVVIILGLLNKKQQRGIIIALILFFALIYIIVGWLLIHNSFLVISNQITDIEQVTDKCVQNAINSTELFFLNQESAINKALCSYPIELSDGCS